MLETLYQLIIGHAVTDYALQSKHHMDLKNRNTSAGKHIWFLALSAHSILNGGAVYIVTGSMVLGVLETVFHFWIDFLKCDGQITMLEDQLAHGSCKILWALCASMFI